eukprot:TRINITY_DN2832_c0_g1_i3.p1 TRINITY_DN2832_c0_g1~~TRINITY_DN2832_c0_g1_i3.p1  ORF type:complete len:118 (-),score=17.15 TRINITY_DN2832_c0_g1_i3:494-847(-)
MNKRFQKRKEIPATNVSSVVQRLSKIPELSELLQREVTCEGVAIKEAIDWSRVPVPLDPSFGVLENRAKRKRLQINAMAAKILPYLEDYKSICVEFGAGSGHLGLLLAYLRALCRYF